jgi:hypothetical protein
VSSGPFTAVTIGDTRTAPTLYQYEMLLSLCIEHDVQQWVPEIDEPIGVDNHRHHGSLWGLSAPALLLPFTSPPRTNHGEQAGSCSQRIVSTGDYHYRGLPHDKDRRPGSGPRITADASRGRRSRPTPGRRPNQTGLTSNSRQLGTAPGPAHTEQSLQQDHAGWVGAWAAGWVSWVGLDRAAVGNGIRLGHGWA